MSELQATVAKRIKQCRTSHGWTMDETAKRLSVIAGKEMSPSRYSNWELGLRMPGPEQMIHLGQLFGKPAAWVQGFTDNDSLSAVSSNYVTANSPNIATKSGLLSVTQATDSTAYSLDYLAARGLNRNKLLSIQQIDKSMAGVIEEGAEVLLDLDQQTVRGADLFGIAVAGHIWIRFIRPELNGTYTITAADNSQYTDQNLSTEQFKDIDVIGRVVRIAHDR
jgi:transcriptional regulator with XRE-family HTH domain